MAEVSNAGKARAPRGVRAVPAAFFACWVLGALVFAALPVGSPGRSVAAGALYTGAMGFALFALARAVGGTRGRQRLFWGLLVAGILSVLLGDLGWSDLQGPLGSGGASVEDAAYLVSYLFLAAAMLLLVSLTTRGIAFITALDALAVMLSAGVFTWYFFLGEAVSAAGASGSPAAFSVLSWLLFDAALLFLGLVVVSTAGKPPFAGLLAAGFLAFAAADGLYLVSRASGSYGDAGWPDVVWALGFGLIGLGALRAAPASFAEHRIESWRVFLFWLGPLSPPVHLGVVLLWAVTHPPLPAFAAAGGAALFLYLALRVALVSFTSRRLSEEREALARDLEGGRILSEMHDTVKQGVHGVSLTLRAAQEAGRRGDHDAELGMIETALRAARETEFQVSRPYEELQTSLHGGDALRPRVYLRQRLDKFEDYFGIKTFEDLQAPLEGLSPLELAAVYRVTVEAFWNVAKHSRASSMNLESRRVGDLLLLRVRDDGRGFDPTKPPPGMGLRYMRQRASEVGADLDVISAPGRGTTVQLRFRNKGRGSGIGSRES